MEEGESSPTVTGQEDDEVAKVFMIPVVEWERGSRYEVQRILLPRTSCPRTFGSTVSWVGSREALAGWISQLRLAAERRWRTSLNLPNLLCRPRPASLQPISGPPTSTSSRPCRSNMDCSHLSTSRESSRTSPVAARCSPSTTPRTSTCPRRIS